MSDYVERERREDIDFEPIEKLLAPLFVGTCYFCGQSVLDSEAFQRSVRPIHEKCIVPMVSNLEMQLATLRATIYQNQSFPPQQYPGFIPVTYPGTGTVVTPYTPYQVMTTVTADSAQFVKYDPVTRRLTFDWQNSAGASAPGKYTIVTSTE